jgi:hypothetical protein
MIDSVPPSQPPPVDLTGRVRLAHRADLLDRGVSADEIKRRLARGELTPLRRGIYVPTVDLRSLSSRQCHVLQVDATMCQVGPEMVVSHQSAACLLDIKLLRVPAAVQVTNPGGRAGHRRSRLHTHCATVDVDEVTVVGDHRVTSAARTIVDLARLCPFEDAVVAADSALRLGRVTREELFDAVGRAARRPGVFAARRVVRFADRGAESAGESVSRVLIDRQALPRPELQVAVFGAGGYVFAHSDFGWRACNTVGEFDGAQKYGRLLRPGEPPGDRIYQEKIREDRIRALGWHVVRWTWQDLEEPKELAERIRRALAYGASMTRT